MAKDSNCYRLAYDSVVSEPDDAVQAEVLLETSFAEVSFPTVTLSRLIPFAPLSILLMCCPVTLMLGLDLTRLIIAL